MFFAPVNRLEAAETTPPTDDTTDEIEPDPPRRVTASGRVVLTETGSRATLPEPLYLHKDVTCQVSEPRNGAKAPENWTVKATVNGHRLTLPGSFLVATRGPKSYLVRVANHYRAVRISGS